MMLHVNRGGSIQKASTDLPVSRTSRTKSWTNSLTRVNTPASHYTMGLSIALRISNVYKCKDPDFPQFGRNYLKLFGTGEKLPEDTGEMFYLDFCQKCDEKHEGG